MVEAQIYRLDDLRLQRSIRTFTGAFFQTPSVSDGLALCASAMSFSAMYVAAMASFHHQVLSAAFWPYSKWPKGEANQSPWR